MARSGKIFSELPDAERKKYKDRKGLARELHTAQGTRCALCEDEINLASEYDFDHKEPLDAGGETRFSNLQLAHPACNKLKSNYEHDVREYLKLRRLFDKADQPYKYDGVLDHFDIKAQPVELLGSDNTLDLYFPDGGSKTSVPIFSEKAGDKEVRYAFVELPRNAIFNDDEVQPRTIKIQHAFSIFNDLQSNPLHEPPSCRLDTRKGSTDNKLRMFDGQHKTVASWMLGRETIVAKVYLDFETAEARELVNSIQSRIKKLPLSAFEFVAKMGSEYEDKLEDYVANGDEPYSETGFIRYLPAENRNAAKKAFEASLIGNLLNDEELLIHKYVKQPGRAGSKGLTETQVKNKILKILLHTKPLAVEFDEGNKIRNIENKVALRIINKVVELVFDHDESDQAKERLTRISYQASLEWLFTAIRKIYTTTLLIDDDDPMKLQPTNKQWEVIEGSITRAVHFGVWTCDRDQTGMVEISNAWSKNQNLSDAFKNRHLTWGALMKPADMPSMENFLKG